MIDERGRYERAFAAFRMPEPSWDRLLGRRHRRRRNQRIAAGVVGMAVFLATIWFVSSAGPLHRTHSPGGPQPTAPSITPTPTPAPTQPSSATGIGFTDRLPPTDLAPSAPERGELVLDFAFGHTFGDPGRFVGWLYEDGRFIWERLAPSGPTGLVEQRLTPDGVELVLSDVASTGLLDRDLDLTSSHGLFFGQIEVRSGDRLVHVAWGDDLTGNGAKVPTQEQADALKRLDARLADPASWLPPGAWVDPAIRPYVASRYTVWFEWRDQEVPSLGMANLLRSLPRSAETLLRAAGITRRTYTNLAGTHEGWFATLSTEQAHALDAILQGAAHQAPGGIRGPLYEIRPSHGSPQVIDLSIEPVLPHE
jgi:hypothetical protein